MVLFIYLFIVFHRIKDGSIEENSSNYSLFHFYIQYFNV